MATQDKNFIVKNGIDAGGAITATGNVSGNYLLATNSSGDEGGEILLSKAVTNTTIAGTGVTIDVYQNKLRFFEQGGSARGYYIDITGGGAGVGTNLATGGGTGTVTNIATGAGLTGGPITTTGTISIDSTATITGGTFVPTSSTVPTNGMYLPAANTIAFSTNSTASRLTIDGSGRIGIIAAAGPDTSVLLGGTAASTSTTLFMYRNIQVVNSGVTGAATGFANQTNTQAATFTLSDYAGFRATQNTLGTNSVITNQSGFDADGSLTGATNNYGFRGRIASGTGRWNLFMDGTAANYFAGQTIIGSTSLTLGNGGTANNTAHQFGIVSAATTNIVQVIRGAASQTGALTQWQDSAGSILAAMSSAGAFTAVTKSFDIEHPTKEGMRLRYGSLEGPENGVYIRGKSESKTIKLPDYWKGLVDKDTITVQLTSIGSGTIYVESIKSNSIKVGGTSKEFFYLIQAERKDVDKLIVEY